MRFAKLHGYGNDYVVLEENGLSAGADFPSFVRRICDRHYGAGSDGVALLGRVEASRGDYEVRIFNPDGSEAAMSGNGSRCAAAYLYDGGLWDQSTLRLATRAGTKTYHHLGADRASGVYRFRAEIGRPAFARREIPMREDVRDSAEEAEARVVDYPLSIGEGVVRVTALQMCNPNCCVLVDDFDELDWRGVGRAIETHEMFPERTNVEFVRVVGPRQIEVRIWERGAGETLSSGTGSSAAAVAAMMNGLTERRVSVTTPGGESEVEWREADGEVLLTGTAQMIYRGEWLRGQ